MEKAKPNPAGANQCTRGEGFGRKHLPNQKPSPNLASRNGNPLIGRSWHRYQNQVNVPDVLAATSNFAMSMSS